MAEAHCGFNGQPDVLMQSGPVLYVDIGPDSSFDLYGSRSPDLETTHCPALVDTGTSDSCIDSAMASELQLPIAERYAVVSGAHGPAQTNMYPAQIYVPSLHLVMYGQFAGVRLAVGGQPHAALIGRDLLRHCTMVYNGTTGDVVLTNSLPTGDPP